MSIRRVPKWWAPTAAVLLVAVSGCQRAAAPAARLPLAECTVAGVSARCGTLDVLENRAGSAGRHIALRVVVLPARAAKPAPDPVFWLAGGPGGAATEDITSAVRLLASVNEQRDLVFVDQRGTGGSNKLTCPQDGLSNCLSTIDADVGAYTTAWAMDDLDDVRAALGYARVNVYGGSYGATAAQVYLQRHPQHTRTATLVAGQPLDVPMLEHFPSSSQHALDLVFAGCAKDPACHRAYPDPAADLATLIRTLDRGPAVLPLTDPGTGRHAQFTRQDLGPGIHNLLVDAQTAAQLPQLLHLAARGDWAAVAKALPSQGSGDNTPPTWQLMNLTILCHEPWAVLRPGPTQADAASSYLSYADVRALTVPEDVCAATPVPPAAAMYAPPRRIPVPTLMLNGEADPQDPPAGLGEVSRLYPDSATVTLPGQSHRISLTTSLIDQITSFITTGATPD